MKKYLLLRNNQETGPHSIEQLASIGLYPMDLIWIEDESTAWKYPEEIEELKGLVKQDIVLNHSNHAANKKDKIFISLPSNFYRRKRQDSDDPYSFFPVNETEAVLETNYIKPLEELKENYRSSNQKRPVWNRKLFSESKTASVVAIFVGVVLGAFVIKKTVDDYVPGSPEETAVATPIIDREVVKQPDENIKNALVTELVPVYKTAPAKTARKTDLKKQLKVTANNYKVGLFGGINGLQLTVFNTSAQPVDKVIVGLDYLKPNGAVVQSGNVVFSSIRPKGMQTLSVPGSARGVKVRYKILKAKAHDYKTDLKEV